MNLKVKSTTNQGLSRIPESSSNWPKPDTLTAMASKAIRLSPALKEIRLHLCQKSAASSGAREFVEKHYVPLKSENPQFPILIRECSGIQPKLWARYGYGREEGFDIGNKSSKDILDVISGLQ